MQKSRRNRRGQGKRLLAMVLVVMMMLGMVPGGLFTPATSYGASPSGYDVGSVVEINGTQYTVTDVIQVTPLNTVALTTGQVCVLYSNNITRNTTITVSGTPIIILDGLYVTVSAAATPVITLGSGGACRPTFYVPDGVENRLHQTSMTEFANNAAISVPGNAIFSMFGGEDGTGKLYLAGGYNSAAIGTYRGERNASVTGDKPSGVINILGGTVVLENPNASIATRGIGAGCAQKASDITIGNNATLILDGISGNGIGTPNPSRGFENIYINGGTIVSAGSIGKSYYSSDYPELTTTNAVHITGGRIITKDLGSNVSFGGAAATNVIDSGSVYVENTPHSRPINSKNQTLYLTTVDVVDVYGNSIGDTKLSIVVNKGTANEYTYEAETYTDSPLTTLDDGNDGKAWLWLPVGNYTVAVGDERYGLYEEDLTVSNNDNNAKTIVIGAKTTLSHTPDDAEVYDSTVDFTITADNAADLGGAKDIGQVWWFRENLETKGSYPDYDAFIAAYGNATAADKGGSGQDLQADSGNDEHKSIFAKTKVDKNGAYWAMVEYTSGTGHTYYQIESLDITNLYTAIDLRERGRIGDGSVNGYLYGGTSSYEDMESTYFVPYDLNGTTVLTSPRFPHQQLVLDARAQYQDHWEVTLKDTSNQWTVAAPKNLTLNQSFLDTLDSYADGDSPRRYTLQYQKKAGMWGSVKLKYVDSNGETVIIDGAIEDTLSVPVDPNYTGDVLNFYEYGGRYSPPYSSDGRWSPVAYYVGNTFSTNSSSWETDFSPFDPAIIPNGTTTVYIVFESDVLTVAEHYVMPDGVTEWATTSTSLIPNQDYNKSALAISGYVPVRYTISGLAGSASKSFTFDYDTYTPQLDPDESQYSAFDIFLDYADLTDHVVVTFYYAEDAGRGVGIPKDEAAKIDVRWTGTYLNNQTTTLGEDSFYTRLGNGSRYEVTVTNDDGGGDIDHFIPDTTGGMWWFDNEKPTPGIDNSVRTFAPSGDATVSFYYDYDSNNEGIPDRKQVVIEKYRIFEDYSTELKGDVAQQHYLNILYEKEAPTITGFVPVGWYEGDYDASITANDIGHITRTDREVKASFTPVDTEEIVTYIYREEAKPVTVKWVGKTYAGNDVTLETMVVQGYVDEEIHVYRSDIALAAQWLPVEGSDDDYLIKLSDTAQNDLTFEFYEYSDIALISVKGTSTDSSINYSYEVTKRSSDDMFTVEAWELADYKVTGYVVYDQYGNELDSGNGKVMMVDPAEGSIIVVFNYQSTITTVEVHAIDADTGVEIYSETLTGATIGEPFAATAPYVGDNWQLVGDVIGKLSIVVEGKNDIYFNYKELSGNLTILLKEAYTDGSETILKVEKMDISTSQTISAPSLANDYYQAITAPISVIYEAGVDKTIEFYYEKDLIDVTILAIDDADGTTELARLDLPQAARKGEMYTATALTVPWYSLIESASKAVYADPASDPLVVEFRYREDQTGDVRGIHFYVDENGDEVILGEFTGRGVVGSKFTMGEGEFDGFEFKASYIGETSTVGSAANEVEIIVSDDPDENVVRFEYNDVRKVITIKVKVDDNAAYVHETRRFPAGEETTIYAPSLTDQVLTAYQLDNGTAADVDQSNPFTGLDFTGANAISGDHTITFYYTDMSEVIEGRAKSITIRGVDAADGSELYRYAISGDAGSSKYVNPLAIPNYTTADSGQSLEFGKDSQHTFIYDSDFITITIVALDDLIGTAISGYLPQTYQAAKGQNFTAYAPVLSGWVIADGKQEEVVAAPTQDATVIFRYETAENMVLIKAIDHDTGEVIKVVGKDLPDGGHNIVAADELEPLTGWVLRSGEAPNQNINVPADPSVEFRYVKDTVTVAVRGYESGQSGDLYRTSYIDVQVGSQFTGIMEPVTGYQLKGSEPLSKTITVTTSGPNVVEFEYVPADGNVIIIHESDDGDLLYVTYDEGVVGEPYTAYAMSFTGFEANDNSVSGTVLTGGTVLELTITYASVMKSIPVYLVDDSNNPLRDYPVKVQLGIPTTIHAPGLAGYVITGKDRETVTATEGGSESVTFVYRSVDDLSDENYVSITIVAKTADGTANGKTLYEYDVRMLKSLVQTRSIKGYLINLPGYVLDDATNVYDVMPDATKPVDVWYLWHMAEVTIKAELNDGLNTPVPGFASYKAAAEIGEDYTPVAPTIPGYRNTGNSLADGDTTITVAASGTEVTFYYEKDAGNLLIKAVDSENGTLLDSRTETLANGATFTADQAAANSLFAGASFLELYELNQDGTPNSVTYDGINDQEVVYKYDRLKRVVTLQALDNRTGAVIGTAQVQVANLRVLESYNYAADLTKRPGGLDEQVEQVSAGYRRIVSGSNTVLVDKDATTNVVYIYYEPQADQEVPVELWAGKPGITGSELLQSYTVPVASDEIISFVDGPIPDLTAMGLVYNENDSTLVAQEGVVGDKIILVYDDQRTTITVRFYLDGVENTARTAGYKTVEASYDMTTPYIAGYLLDSYEVISSSGVSAGDVFASPDTIPLDTSSGDLELKLYYKNLSAVIEDRSQSILVIGEDAAGQELYRYTLTGDRGVKDTLYPLDVPNYTPTSAATAGVPVEFGVDSDVTFVYETDLATVTIRAVDSSGTAIAGYAPKTYEVVKDTSFTAYAPVLDGWAIKDTGNPTDYEITQMITGDETFTFTYQRAEGLLLVKAVDENDSTNVLKVVGLEKDHGTHNIDADLVLGSILGWERTDADQDKDVDFPADNEVSFQYGKQMVTITLRGEDVDNPANPKTNLYAGLNPSLTNFSRQVGTQFTASMIPLVGYRLNDSKDLAKTITVLAGGATIQFDYKTVTSNVYVIHEVVGTGEILSMKDEEVTPGSSYTASAVQFDGYQLDSAASTQTETVPEDGSELVIRFTYKPVNTTVTIELHDSLWNPADGGTSLLDTIPRTEQIGVWVTIYAPPLAGYVLDLDEIANNNGRLDIQPTGDPTQDVVTFYYKSVDDASNENYVNLTIRGVTGALTHYSYVLRLPKSSDPFTLIDGTHVFNVPGYILDANQLHTITPDQDDTLTFTYTSTDGSVRIVLQDEQGDPVGAGSWSEAATVNDPFTYLAPHVDGYLLVETQPAVPPAANNQSAIGYVAAVAADNSSQIVFTYRSISADVIIICYDDDTQQIIRVVEVNSPVTGTNTPIAAPDLSGEYYTPVSGQQTLHYDYNGSDSVIIEAYYDKDLATIRIIGVDEDTGLEIANTEGFLPGQRKGEVTTVSAPTTPAQYQRSDAASRLVLVDPTLDPASDPLQEEIFYFKSVEETYVPVRVVDADTKEVLQSYGLTATVNEEVKVDPDLIQIAGYTYNAVDPNNQSKLTATAGDGTEILVMLTDIRKVLTVHLEDEEDGSSLGSSVERIVSGTLKTIYPTYVNGYVLIGYRLEASGGAGGPATLVEVDETFTGITDFTNSTGFDADHTVTFVYRKISDYIDGRARSVLVRGLDAVSGDPLYSYTISGDDGSSREIMPLQVPKYTAPIAGETVIFGTDSQVEFKYTSQLALVYIEAVDENGKAIDGYYAKSYEALIGEDYTAYAPVIDGWVVLDNGNQLDYEITRQIIGDASMDTFTFTYVKAEGLVLVKAVEATNPSNVLRVVGQPLADGSHVIDAATTLGAITGWTLTGSAQEQITVPADSEVVFTYDQQNVAVTVRYLDQADPTGQTEIHPADTFFAQEGRLFTASMEQVIGWQLADGEATAKTIYATSGAELTFEYVAGNANVVVVHKDQSSGAILDIDYLELNAGEAYHVSAIDFTGYEVVTPSVVSGNAPTDGSVATVEFGYTSLMTDITVLLMSGTTLLGSDTVSGQLDVAKTIEAPHVNGYTLNDDAAKTITPTLLGLNTVFFQYRSVDEVSEENRVTITIQGVTTTTLSDGSSVIHTHYRYDKRILRSSDPLTLVNGTDVFAVPGYVLEDGQNSKYTVYPNGDQVVTFAYKTTQGTVKITLQEQGTGQLIGQGSFHVDATIGNPFTFPAPYVNGYMVTAVTPSASAGSTIGVIDTVQESAVNEILFEYEKINSQVTIVGKENDANGAIIHQEGLVNPVVGGDFFTAPDLSGSYFSLADPANPNIYYDFDGTNALTVEVYYTKDLVDIELEARDGKTGDRLETYTVKDQRKGEAVTLLADWVKPVGSYVLIEQPARIVIAADNLTEVFLYNSLADSSVMVRVYTGSAAAANEIYGYVIPATKGDTVTIDPATIQLAGYELDASHSDNCHFVIAGDGRDIVVIMTDVRKTLTSCFVDEQGDTLAATTVEKLVAGSAKTIYPTYVGGYVLVGYQLDGQPGSAGGDYLEVDETFTGITDFTAPNGSFDDDHSVTFVYRRLQDYVDNNFVQVTVRGWVENDNTPLYSYTQMRQADSGPYTVTAMDTVGFVLATGQTDQETLNVQAEDLIHTFWYTPLATSVIIKAQLADSAAVPGFTDIETAATINQPFSYNAPYIPGYNLVDDVTKYLIPVTADERTLTFTYGPADGNVVIVLKEDDTNGAVIRTMSDQLSDGETATYAIADPAFDLSGSYYSPVDPDQSITVTHDGTAQTVELYYQKELSRLHRAEYDVTTSRNLIGGPTVLADNYRVGELATVEALALSDPTTPYELVSTTPQLVIVDEDPAQTVEFEYRSIAAHEVVVEAVLAGENGQHTVLQSYTMTATQGRRVTAPAPSLTGYRLANGQAATGSADAPGKITFVYVENQVNISVTLQDAYGNVLRGPAGYAAAYTVPVGLDHKVYAPHVPGYVITGSQSETYYQIETDQNPVFTYRTVDEESDLNHVDILIRGVTGSFTHYSYVRRFERSDLATVLTEGLDLFYVNGYRLAPGQDLSVVPNRDYPEISFEYEQNTALVEIAAVYDDGLYETPIENFTNIYVEAEIGKPFTFITPDIEGFVATGNSGLLSVVTGDRSQDQIVFYYKKGEGNVTVIALEGVEPIGRYQTSLNIGETVDVTRGGSLDPDLRQIDALQYFEPTDAPGRADYSQYDGVNPVTVTFQFTKKTMPVTLVAMNTEQNGEITRLVLDEKQRVLEEFSYADRLTQLDEAVAALLPGAARVGASTTMIVSAAAAENEIQVWYVPPATSVVTVELWIEEPDTGELLQSYFLPATKNGTVALGISQIPDLAGLGLLYDASRSTTSVVEGTGNKILLVYQDQRVEVDVYIVKDIGTPAYRTTQKAVIGSDVLVTAPYFAGYVLKSYKISGSSSEELPNDFEGVKITGITASYNVTFYYQSMDDYLQEEYVNIIVRGLEASTRSELYSHVVTVSKAEDEVTEITAFTVSGYRLEDDGLVLVATDGSQTLVEFLYRSNQTTVTIQALLESGEPVPQFSERSVSAELGQPFTYSAPYIEGFELIDRSAVIGSIEAVSETGNTLVFYYHRSAGGVTVQLVEKGADADDQTTIIASYAETVTSGVPVTIAVPDLSAQYYTALDAPETVTYEGQEIIVTYAYAKQTRDGLFQLYDVTDPANEVLLEEITSDQSYRVGEVAAIEAPAYSGYKLISPAVQYVLIEPTAGSASGQIQSEVVLRQEVSQITPVVEAPEEIADGTPVETSDGAQTETADEAQTETSGEAIATISRSAKRTAEQVVLVGRTTLTDNLLDISNDLPDTGDVQVSADVDERTNDETNEDPTATDSDELSGEDGEADESKDIDQDQNSDDGVDREGPENPASPGDLDGSDEDGEPNDRDDDGEPDGSAEDDENDLGEEPDQNQTGEPQAIRFDYASAEENEIVVNAIGDETGKLLYSYTLTGANGETRTINAPQLAGYALAKDEDAAKRQTISGVVEFRYTQNLVVVTYLLVDENGEIINAPDWIATSHNVAKGANYTAYAPHIPGYALTGQQNLSLTNVTSPQEVTFTYRYDGSDQGRQASITVHYLKAEDQTTVIKTGNLDGYYVGERFLLLPSLPESFNHGGRKYQLDEALTATAPTYLLAENDFYAYYQDNGAESTTGGGGGGGGNGNYTTATLTVHGVDVRTGNLIYNQSVTVVVGSKETIKAPTITGYALDAASESSQTITITEGTNLVTFNYNYTGGEVDLSGGPGGTAGSTLSRELLNLADHYAYISGYPTLTGAGDGTVRPENWITREEVAMIFYRILTDSTRSSYFSQTNQFSDVSYGWWSNDAISTIANLGLVQGDPEGTFRPGDNITRAEMAVIVAKFTLPGTSADGAGTGTGDRFDDIGTHWANSYINRAARAGFINGDGGMGSNFRPDDNMTRAEVMALVNQLLGRVPPTAVSDLDSDMIQWSDNRDAGKWYYYHVQEATNSHHYEIEENGAEKWNGLRSNHNWS